MTRHFGVHFAPPSSGFHGANAAAGEHRQPRLSPAPVAANIMSGPVRLGGTSTNRPAYGARNTYRADSFQLAASKPSGSPASMAGLGRTLQRQDEGALFPLPRGSLIDPGSALLKRDNLLHAVRDGLAVAGAALFLTVTGIALVASLFMMFFCEF